MALILVIDDDPVVRSVAEKALSEDGHRVELVSTGAEALARVAANRPDALVLDIVMPEVNGLEVCRRIRADPYLATLPIIFLTGRDRPRDVAEGLDAGGDDYLSKDAIRIELPARVRAVLRRVGGHTLDPESDTVTVNNLTLHRTRPELHIGQEMTLLTPVEHRLLYYLMTHAGQPVSTDQLLEEVWEYAPGTGDPKLVRTHIGNLRAKVEPERSALNYIRNVRGRGYVIGG